jgi:hypothetical protein
MFLLARVCTTSGEGTYLNIFNTDHIAQISRDINNPRRSGIVVNRMDEDGLYDLEYTIDVELERVIEILGNHGVLIDLDALPSSDE